MTAFYPLSHARRALDAAFSFVSQTSALILDVSRNGGGDDETADAVFATLVPTAATRPFDIEFRNRVEPAGPSPERSWDDYGDARPVAVIIGRQSFSAPEALAYALQQAGRATLVGRQTAGGANMLDDANAAGDLFLVGVPTRRPLGLSSRSNWEAIGVRPDVAAGDGDAEMIAWEFVRRQLVNSP